MNSSTSTSCPASPNALPSSIDAMASRASARSSRDDHALSRREPGRLDHDRRAETLRLRVRRRANVRERARARRRHARGEHEFLRESLRRLDPRGRLRRARTPRGRSLESDRRGPASSGPSGPTIVNGDVLAPRERREARDIGRGRPRSHRPSSASPGLPGAEMSSSVGSSARSFQPSACSRAPPPTTSTLTGRPPLNASSNASLARSNTSPSLPTAARAWSP